MVINWGQRKNWGLEEKHGIVSFAFRAWQRLHRRKKRKRMEICICFENPEQNLLWVDIFSNWIIGLLASKGPHPNSGQFLVCVSGMFVNLFLNIKEIL